MSMFLKHSKPSLHVPPKKIQHSQLDEPEHSQLLPNLSSIPLPFKSNTMLRFIVSVLSYLYYEFEFPPSQW